MEGGWLKEVTDWDRGKAAHLGGGSSDKAVLGNGLGPQLRARRQASDQGGDLLHLKVSWWTVEEERVRTLRRICCIESRSRTVAVPSWTVREDARWARRT